MFELKRNTAEFPYRRFRDIREGCTLGSGGSPELVKAFTDMGAALEALKSCQLDIRLFSGAAGLCCHVTEYYVEEVHYDGDGGWTSGGDIWVFSLIPYEVLLWFEVKSWILTFFQSGKP